MDMYLLGDGYRLIITDENDRPVHSSTLEFCAISAEYARDNTLIKFCIHHNEYDVDGHIVGIQEEPSFYYLKIVSQNEIDKANTMRMDNSTGRILDINLGQ